MATFSLVSLRFCSACLEALLVALNNFLYLVHVIYRCFFLRLALALTLFLFNMALRAYLSLVYLAFTRVLYFFFTFLSTYSSELFLTTTLRLLPNTFN